MNQHTGRTVIASIVFVDIVGYSKSSGAQQFAMKSLLNRTIQEALSDIAESERIVLDTGDGAALCFIGDPEDALFVASAVRDAIIRHDGDGRHSLRIGINLGPVKFVTDLNGQTNVVGDGINVAERVMSFAGDDELLVSRSYYEVVARLSDGNDRFFRYLGEKKDKHVREHQVYAFGGVDGDPEAGNVAPEDEAAELALRRTRDDDGGVPDNEVRDAIARRLGDRIGPLARVIVGRAARSAADADGFFELVAAAIPDPADRADFLAEMNDYAASSPADRPRADQRVAPTTAPASGVSEAEIAEAERVLAQIIGPIARVMVRKAAESACNRSELYDRLADSINSPVDRERFRAAIRKNVS
ncbi:MAG: adenylate/guanylate cyclase domain-containing protein [Alphaproteobacteria bacterium]|jgi:class 3 adenylate cyclase